MQPPGSSFENHLYANLLPIRASFLLSRYRVTYPKNRTLSTPLKRFSSPLPSTYPNIPVAGLRNVKARDVLKFRDSVVGNRRQGDSNLSFYVSKVGRRGDRSLSAALANLVAHLGSRVTCIYAYLLSTKLVAGPIIILYSGLHFDPIGQIPRRISETITSPLPRFSIVKIQFPLSNLVYSAFNPLIPRFAEKVKKVDVVRAERVISLPERLTSPIISIPFSIPD